MKEKSIYIPIERINEEKQEVAGWAQTEEEGSDGLILTNEAMRKALDEYFEDGSGPMWEMHQNPVGLVKEAQVINTKGTFVRGKVVDPIVWLKVKEGVYKGFSVRGYITAFGEEDKSKITGFELREISLVDKPADKGAKITLFRVATRFADLPIDMEKSWDGDAARKRVAKWAGGPDKESIDWKKYRQAFFWYDENNPENYGSYKLPFADVIEGRLTAIWRGVAAAMAALLKARRGVDIPEKDRKLVYNHIKRYYQKAGKEAPDFRLYSPRELREFSQEKLEVGGELNMAEEKKDLKVEEKKAAPTVKAGTSGDEPKKVGDAIVDEVQRILKESLPEIVKATMREVVESSKEEDEKLEELERIKKEIKEKEETIRELLKRVEELEKTPIPPKLKAAWISRERAEEKEEVKREKAEPLVKRLKELEAIRDSDLRSYERQGLGREAQRLLAQLYSLGFTAQDVKNW